jgi:hypothetical protein
MVLQQMTEGTPKSKNQKGVGTFMVMVVAMIAYFGLLFLLYE